MIHEDAGDAFPGRWPPAAGRTFSPGRGEIGQTATAPGTRTDRRWLALAAEMAGLTSGSWRPAPEPGSTGPLRLPRVATRALGADAGEVRAGRDFAVATLHRWAAAERSPDIAIVVSELLTNALRHALPGSGDTRPRPRRPIQLGLLQPASCILCAVADPSRMVPAPRAQTALGETGRGLHIICALSDQWGYVRSDRGKVVWAMFYRR
jgi:anti-sigma regulatory factor (Ser/Thr protein kinase)